ncbi:hypothetical protein [Brumimicrobium aurantiacum]|nr:hypothetical protein [Brumimicrobium aurantiacum]
MKKLIPLAFVGLFIVSIASSCGSSKAKCDAYSDVETQTEQNDLAQH